MRCPLFLLATVLGLAACAPAETPKTVPMTPALPEVGVKPLSALAILPERDAPAVANSRNEARISAEVAAVILALPVQVGEVVAPGAVLARLDPRDAELALARAEAGVAQAQARLAQANAQLSRARRLTEQNFYSPDALSQRETEVAALAADLKAAQAGRDTAARALAKCTLRAPFPAIVSARSGQVGELAAPGTPLVTVLDRSRLEVAAKVQARDVASLEAAREIVFESAGGRHPLRLERVSPAISREARSVEVRLAFAGAAAPPGAEGRIVWRDVRPHLPADYVLRRGERYGAFIAEAGRARFIVLAEASEGRPAAVALPPETALVTDGRLALKDGDAIRVAGSR